jgi:hypothetical protein
MPLRWIVSRTLLSSVQMLTASARKSHAVSIFRPPGGWANGCQFRNSGLGQWKALSVQLHHHHRHWWLSLLTLSHVKAELQHLYLAQSRCAINAFFKFKKRLIWRSSNL